MNNSKPFSPDSNIEVQRLESALEAAGTGTWELDLKTDEFRVCKRFKKVFDYNFRNVTTLDQVLDQIHADDCEAFGQTLQQIILENSQEEFECEFRAVHREGSDSRWISCKGKLTRGGDGKPLRLSGVVQNITERVHARLQIQLNEERFRSLFEETQIALEQLVEERTQQLLVANEGLAALNEEYLTTNEQLAKTVELLSKSNDSLQQFAYVASHDLQEPLRKIKTFGDLLSHRYAADLGEGNQYLHRMQAAAQRMSSLIEDLLTLSKVSSFSEDFQDVPLSEIVTIVLSDLELVIAETGAVITVNSLPLIKGDRMQLEQLFQNLLSNALKFRHPDRPVEITVKASEVLAADLPAHVKPLWPSAQYYRVDISDNGIGFDPKDAERIFQVFQRLHGKHEFSGTGIGLAICEKVVANHGGAIVASGNEGLGSTFSIYFLKQSASQKIQSDLI